jgi:NADH-quinone oxidoreductase subunit A
VLPQAVVGAYSKTVIESYIPVLLHVIVAVGFATAALVANLVVGRVGRRNPSKELAYECGMLPEHGPQPRFSVKFYLVAMLFILFDIEIVFMYPWAVVYRPFVEEFGPMIFWSMLSFILILLFGYLYAVKKGALDWDERRRAGQ